MNMEWIVGSEIRVGFDGQAVVISANREGLLSLAKQFEALAAEPRDHIHYDAYNSLADGSVELIVEKV